MVTIQIDNLYSQIMGDIPVEAQMQISSECSYVPIGTEYVTSVMAGGWDGSYKLYNPKNRRFPTGLLSRVRKILIINNVQFEIQDLRRQPILGTPVNIKATLRPYQDIIVREAPQYTRGIVKVGTGGGKSIIMSAILGALNVKTAILVPTIELARQTKNVLEEKLGITVGYIAEGVRDIQRVDVVGIQALTAFKDAEFNQYCASIECIMIDEAHMIAADTVRDIAKKCVNAYYRFGFSATPWREDGKDMLIEAWTGRAVWDVSASTLIRDGYLARPIINLVHLKHSKLDRGITYPEAYKSYIVENEHRNNVIVNLCAKHLQENQSILIHVKQIKHGQLLETIMHDRFPELKGKILFVDSERNKNLEGVLKKLHDKDYLCIIATPIYRIGVDIPSLDVTILAKASDSSIDTLQTVGRALRKTEDKSVTTIYDIYDEGCRWFGKHSVKRKDTYRWEPEFKLVDVNDKGEVYATVASFPLYPV